MYDGNKGYRKRAQENNRIGNCETCKYRNTCLMKWTDKQCMQHRVTIKFPVNPESFDEDKIQRDIARRVKAIQKHKSAKERSGK